MRCVILVRSILSSLRYNLTKVTHRTRRIAPELDKSGRLLRLWATLNASGNKFSNECRVFVIWESYSSTRKPVPFAEIRSHLSHPMNKSSGVRYVGKRCARPNVGVIATFNQVNLPARMLCGRSNSAILVILVATMQIVSIDVP